MEIKDQSFTKAVIAFEELKVHFAAFSACVQKLIAQDKHIDSASVSIEIDHDGEGMQITMLNRIFDFQLSITNAGLRTIGIVSISARSKNAASNDCSLIHEVRFNRTGDLTSREAADEYIGGINSDNFVEALLDTVIREFLTMRECD